MYILIVKHQEQLRWCGAKQIPNLLLLLLAFVYYFLQTRNSHAPPRRSARLAKDALCHAQVIYTCMSLQFIQMAVSCILHRGPFNVFYIYIGVYIILHMLCLCNCTIYMIMQRPVSAFARTPSSISSYFLFNIKKKKIIKLFIIQVNGFMQSRESDAPRSERLAKHALYTAQVIYTCMSACHLTSQKSPYRAQCIRILQNTVFHFFIFSVHYFCSLQTNTFLMYVLSDHILSINFTISN